MVIRGVNILRALTGNVATGSCRDDNLNKVANTFCKLEITIEVVTDLDKDPGPVDAVDGAEVVVLGVLQISKNCFDRNIQVI